MKILPGLPKLSFAVVILLSLWCALGGPASAPSTATDASTTSASQIAATTSSTAASQSQPASTQAISAAQMARRLAEEGVTDLLSGKIDKGLAAITDASSLAPEDADLASTIEAVREYRKAEATAAAERQAEYQSAVDQVERAMMVQKHLPALAKSGLDKPLRQKTKQLSEAYRELPLSSSLAEASDEQAVKMKATALKTIPTAVEAVDAAMSIVKKDTSEYGRSFRQLGATLQTRLRELLKLWKDIDVSSEKARKLAAENLFVAEEQLVDAVANVQTLTDKEPYYVALVYARLLARQIAVPSDNMREQGWYKALIADAKTRGEKAMKDADWSDAVGIYVSLKDLEEDNKEFAQAAKVAGQHSRVLGLYGGGADLDLGEVELPDPNDIGDPGETPVVTTQTATAPAEDRIDWRELTEGIDAEMVRSAIKRLDEKYVTTPDYRKIANGGLTALRVLAETPQASKSFPALADKDKRQAFVADVNRLIDHVNKKDNVDSLDLQLAWNSVLRASERSVKIPVGVLAMEFTDAFLEEMDRFSTMVWPHDVPDFQKQTMGRFFGIGIQIAKDKGEPLKVVTPLPGSPAHKAGIKTGDFILAVDGTPTDNYTLDKLVSMIMGEQGTKVTLRVKRRGIVDPFDVDVIRDEIKIVTVRGWRYLPDGRYDYMLDPENKIAYMRISQFTEQTQVEVASVLSDLREQGVRSLIMDLRDNPGGLLRTAASVTDEFLDKGTIVSTRGIQTRPQELRAQDGGNYLDGDLVVLVNKLSASAAEIVSGALKDWKRSITVGERSYGKGSVQEVLPIPRHSALLKLTTARYFLPMGRCLHRENGNPVWGVDPDVAVLLTPREIRHLLEARRKTDLLQESPDQDEQTRELAKQYKADIQLNTAVMVLKVMRLKRAEETAAARE